MVRKRKIKKGGDRSEFLDLPTPRTVESKTTQNNLIQRNTAIENENSDNSTNQTQIQSQNYQRGGYASSKAEGLREYYYPNFGKHSDAAMNAAAATSQLQAHAIMDGNINKVQSRSGELVRSAGQRGGGASLPLGASEELIPSASASNDSIMVNAGGALNQLDADRANDANADVIQHSDGSTERTCPSCTSGGGRKTKRKRRRKSKKKRRKTKKRRRRKSKKRRSKRRK